MDHYDILIVGGGAAGIAAAKAARGASVLLVDQKPALGGILLQCAHRGFGKNQTGAQYAATLLQDFPENIHLALNTTVLSVSSDRIALLSGRDSGLRQVRFSQLILATGCREIPAGALPISGTRPTNVYTAGQMQEMMNLHGHIPEGPVVILGGGDLGLIMADQISGMGIEVAAIVEQKEQLGGMIRNQRFLSSRPIPLYFSNTVSEISGYPNLEGVTLKDGTRISCRTLLIAVGLRPEQELIRSLSTPNWLHLCGNCSSIHPMVEAVIAEGMQAGRCASDTE